MKKCPYCAEEIQEEAIKCKHCGEFLNKTAGNATFESSGKDEKKVKDVNVKSSVMVGVKIGIGMFIVLPLIILGILLLIWWGGVFSIGTVRDLNRDRLQALKLNCQSNLRQMGIAIKTYQNDYNQAFPPKLSVLQPKYINNMNIFKCPASTSRVSSAASSDYGFNKTLPKTATPDSPMAADRDGTHPLPNKFNVLFVDGHADGAVSKPSEISDPD